MLQPFDCHVCLYLYIPKIFLIMKKLLNWFNEKMLLWVIYVVALSLIIAVMFYFSKTLNLNLLG
jgi:cell division protein FtsL